MKLLRPFLTALVLMLSAQPASAHFVFVHVVGGPTPRIELHFAESAWDFTAGERMVDILARARGWLRNGEALEFSRRPFGLVATLPPSTDLALAAQTYGVIERGGEQFLLEYYAKGVGSLAAAGSHAGLDLEIVATEDEPGRLTLTVLLRGEPAPGAELIVPTIGMLTERRETDANGQVIIATPTTPLYGLRAMVAEERDGKHADKAFGLVKHYTTLTVNDSSATPKGCDGLAWALLDDAARACAAITKPGSGWSADFNATLGSASALGQIAGDGATIRVADASVPTSKPIAEQLRLLSWLPDMRTQGGARVQFAEGRQPTAEVRIELPAEGVTYVIRERHIVTRLQQGEHGIERLDVTSWGNTHDERVLPQHLVFTEFDATGQIQEVALLEQRYLEVDDTYILERQTGSVIKSPSEVLDASIRLTGVDVRSAVEHEAGGR